MEKLTAQEFNKASDEAVTLYRRTHSSYSVAMAASAVAEDYGMDDAEFDRLYAEIEFWVGKKKSN